MKFGMWISSMYDDRKIFCESLVYCSVSFYIPLISLVLLFLNKYVTKKNKIMWGLVLGT